MSAIIALIFDFDDTLAHDSTSDFLESMGVDVEDFWGTQNRELLESGWDPVPAYLYQLISLSKSLPDKERITREKLTTFGSRVRLFAGLPSVFDHLKQYSRSVDESVALEFYIVSSGIGDILRHTPVAPYMKAIFSSDFHYNPQNEIEFPRRVVSFTDKTRYLFQISKGLIGKDFEKDPFAVNRRTHHFRIPMNNMIFVGDGFTDIPCFSLINKNNGTALAVLDKENPRARKRAWGFVRDGRVSNLHSTNYNTDSDLVMSLELAISSIIQRNKLQSSIFSEK